MGYLIDGNNLIGHGREQNLKDPHARVRLIRELAAFSRQNRTEVTVIFDGEPDSLLPLRDMRLGTLKVIFAGRGRDADTLILRTLARSPDPAGLTVVTSDKALSDRARHARARTVRSHQFRHTLARQHIDESRSDATRLSEAEVAEWLDYFSRKDGSGE